MELFNQHKLSVSPDDFASVAEDSGAWFRGYATGPVEYLPGNRILACGLTLATEVVEVTTNRIVIDGEINREDIENPDNCDPLVDFRGTSGSAVWDPFNKLIGVLWGGDETANEIWVVPASHIVPSLQRCLSRGL